MNSFVKDFVDRVGSTIVQSLGGSMTALVAGGTVGALADWRLALVTAGSAGLLAAVKVFGVAAAPRSPVDDAAVTRAIAAKLRG